jgi:ABC-type multidrug transport system fused ATPase/permease subunit
VSDRPFSLLLYFVRTLSPSVGWTVVLVVLVVTTSAVPVGLALVPAAMAQLWTHETVRLFGADKPGAAWLWIGVQALLVFNVAFLLLQLWQQLMGARLGEGIMVRLRERVFGWLGRQSSFGQSTGSIGDAVQRLTGDAQQVRQLIYPGLLMSGIDVFQVAYTLIGLLALEFWFTLALASGLVLVLLLSGRLHRRLIALAARDREVNSRLMNQMIEASAGLRDLIAAGRFPLFAEAFARTSVEKRRVAIATTFWGALAGSALPYFITIGISAYYMLAVRDCCDPATAAVDIGRTVSYAFLLGSLQRPIAQLASFRAQVILAQPAMVSLRRTASDAAAGLPPAAPVQSRDAAWSHIAVSGVGYAYPGAPARVLQHITFDVPRGSFTGIVGESGSGKSTLAHLMLGTLTPTEGAITAVSKAGVVPIANLAGARLIGYIPQQPFIFDTSIRENILMGLRDTDVSGAELQRAIETAQLETLIDRRGHEGGLDAPCGPGGRLLSGGERQRVALARALLSRPEILICDEHTANVDAATALLIRRALSDAFSGCTRIVVSHQLYSLRGADQLIVLHHGTVYGSGRHEDLLATCDVYRTFWELQRLE